MSPASQPGNAGHKFRVQKKSDDIFSDTASQPASHYFFAVFAPSIS
jgi:hypothetical protein